MKHHTLLYALLMSMIASTSSYPRTHAEYAQQRAQLKQKIASLSDTTEPHPPHTQSLATPVDRQHAPTPAPRTRTKHGWNSSSSYTVYARHCSAPWY